MTRFATIVLTFAAAFAAFMLYAAHVVALSGLLLMAAESSATADCAAAGPVLSCQQGLSVATTLAETQRASKQTLPRL